MPTKQQIITIGVLCIVAFGLGYWDGPFEKDSGQRAEVVAPTIITNVVTNIVKVPAPLPVKPPAVVTDPSFMSFSNNKLTEVPKGLEKLPKLEELYLDGNQLTDVTGLEKLTQLTYLNLWNNPDLTKAQIGELHKALPNCNIGSNPTK